MAERRKRAKKRDIESYPHADKERANNPPVGLVTPETDRDEGRKRYEHDPHLDPRLSWAGKAEHTSFEVPTVSLHVQERIDPAPSSGRCASATAPRRIDRRHSIHQRRQGGSATRTKVESTMYLVKKYASYTLAAVILLGAFYECGNAFAKEIPRGKEGHGKRVFGDRKGGVVLYREDEFDARVIALIEILEMLSENKEARMFMEQEIEKYGIVGLWNRIREKAVSDECIEYWGLERAKHLFTRRKVTLPEFDHKVAQWFYECLPGIE